MRAAASSTPPNSLLSGRVVRFFRISRSYSWEGFVHIMPGPALICNGTALVTGRRFVIYAVIEGIAIVDTSGGNTQALKPHE